jgi:3-oxoacyl-[acyl-carrier protein] reductase
MDARRVCLFTGISGTLGHDFATRYADTYDIVGVYNSTKPAVPMVGLDAGGVRPVGSIFGVAADLGEDSAVDDLLEQVLRRFESVDVLVNAAVYRRFGPMRRRPFIDSLEWQFYLNVIVPMELASGLIRRTWQQTPSVNAERSRNVVNLSSTAGHRVYPSSGQSGYGASKAALNAFTRHFASEMADLGVRANAVAPNTFPGIVPTAAVSAAVRAYDQSIRNGEVLVIDAEGDYLLAELSAESGAVD